ncbi:cell division protein FtsL [Geminocystis sp. NIES-3708]|uniref:hypothetical protein n=1 Tax=Geminocystis sp. NIES-3708 TaxID=1615909 RepID=UPI0005FC9FF1|nr:hypothetical protein [Geminocystis sp. NIES-3708]BAQ62794.1 cell division protein FtsL [Geminocystis sp. NIES-3708]
MLVQDTLSRRQNNSQVTKTKSLTQKDVTSTRKNLRNNHPSGGRIGSPNNTISQVSHKNRPLWLKSLILFGHGSSLVCYGSVGIAFIIYGMTVYAPKLWTQKYQELQSLQKQERQFSFTDEIIKNQLAESAKKSGSGLVNPDPTQPPIFLPDSTPKPIELEPSNSPIPKQIEKISPIAY